MLGGMQIPKSGLEGHLWITGSSSSQIFSGIWELKGTRDVACGFGAEPFARNALETEAPPGLINACSALLKFDSMSKYNKKYLSGL